MATTSGSLLNKPTRLSSQSPSSSLLKKPTRLSSQSLSASSSSLATEKPTSSTDLIPVPKHLKQTRRSSLDLTKRSSTDLVQKPVHSRRRSFDRPPSTSQVDKVIRNVPETHEVKPLRSTSLSHKLSTSSPNNSIRLPSDRTYPRTTSTLKEGRIDPNVSKSRSLMKKGTLLPSINPPTTKKGIKGPTSPLPKKKPAKSVVSESCIDDHDNHSIDNLLIEDDLMNMDIEVQSLPEMSEMPDIDEELGDPTMTVTEIMAKHIGVFQDIPVFSEHPNQNQTVENQPEKQNVEEPGEEQILTVECSEEVNSKVENVEQNEIALAEESKVEEKEAEKDENPTTVARPELGKARNSVGKKEKQDYNNVIEETASKLMGGRRNKVLALAGAFETVISLQ